MGNIKKTVRYERRAERYEFHFQKEAREWEKVVFKVND